jgi:hypothetical protein
MKLPRRMFLQLTAGAAALPTVSRIARAQAYPAAHGSLCSGSPALGRLAVPILLAPQICGTA